MNYELVAMQYSDARRMVTTTISHNKYMYRGSAAQRMPDPKQLSYMSPDLPRWPPYLHGVS